MAICETSIWVVVTFSALSAGGVLAKVGWSTVNLIVLPLLLIPMVTTLEYALSKRTRPAAA